MSLAKTWPARLRLPIPYQQFFNQLVFLAVGKVAYRLSVTWAEIAAVILVSVAIEHALILFRERRISAFSTAAVSSAFNLAFMLGTTHFEVYAVALAIGLGQKHLFKALTGRHFWNPSNVALVAALLLFPKSTFVTTLDWGKTTWFALVIAGLATALLVRVRLVVLPYVFLAAYTLLSFLLQTRNGDELWLQLNTAGFLLFAFFMLTDPKAVPASRGFTVLHGVITAVIAVSLEAVLGGKEVNMFLALMLSEALVPLWRRLELRQDKPAWLAAGFTAAALGVVSLYVSPYNSVRNTAAAFALLPQAGAPPVEAPVNYPLPSTAGVRLGEADTAWYPAEWREPRMERRPLREQAAAAPRFRRVSDAFAELPLRITPADLGDETRMHAGAGAGDIDHDGDLDLVLTRVREPMRILLNDGGGRFQDAAPLLFAGAPPESVDQFALADLNGDSYLDLIVVHSAYYSDKFGRIYLFSPAEKRFQDSGFRFGKGKHSCGGIAVADVNGDQKPDFYVTYGVNWRSPSIDFQFDADRDEFYASAGTSWTESLASFGPELNGQGYAGMTAMFVDFTRDGRLDFLLGNDFTDPSFVFLGGPQGMRLAPAVLLENNTKDSMSFEAVDFDNDGQAELWENGISNRLAAGRLAFKKEFVEDGRTVRQRELALIEVQKELGKFDCAGFQDALARSVCFDQLHQSMALQTGDEKNCEGITAVSTKIVCVRIARQFRIAGKLHDPRAYKYDVERFPKQLSENVLLKLDGRTGRYRQAILNNDDALFTGASWAAYPFDVDNDGRIDLYVTTGLMQRSHDANRLLLNESDDGQIWLTDRAREWGVALEDESRGAVIADFDGDGDGDLVVNNYLSAPMYFQNESGGKAIEVELRCRGANYGCLGATLELAAGKSIMTRYVAVGGIWNTSQPLVQHFGLPRGAGEARLTVRWPDGSVSSEQSLAPGFRYAILQ